MQPSGRGEVRGALVLREIYFSSRNDTAPVSRLQYAPMTSVWQWKSASNGAYISAKLEAHFDILPLFSSSIFCKSARAMLAKIYSAAVYGVDAYEIEIEVNGGAGDVNIVIFGLPDAVVKESRDRVTTAMDGNQSRKSRKSSRTDQ